MATLPLEIWHEIFALACTDTGLTGRSLSLVSKDFHDISSPFKYQSVAITRWGQLISFSQTFPQLPDIEKKIKYLFIHCPYPFMDVEDNPSIANERCCLDNFDRHLASSGTVFISAGEDSDSDLDYLVPESDSESDSECSGSLDSDGEQEISEDVKYLCTVHDASLPAEGKTREDSLDHDIQAVFDKAIQALHAILNQSSSTLNILTLYWTSFRPLPVHCILPPIPFLDELHLFRCSVVSESVPGNPSTTQATLFPRLRLLFMSGDRSHRAVTCSVPKFAPNLTHFQITRSTYVYDLGDIEWECIGDIVLKTSSKWATDQISALTRGKIDGSEYLHPIMGYLGEIPEAWLCLWSSRVAGRPEAWSAGE